MALESEMVRQAEAARICKVSQSRIHALIRDGKLRTVIGVPIILLYRADVIAWRDREKSKGGRGKKIVRAESTV